MTTRHAILKMLPLLLLVSLVLPVTPLPAQGQDVEDVQGSPRAWGMAAPGFQEEARVSPGGAFVRSLLIPGWGHAATGSYTRGGFYFLAEVGTVWMLYKTGTQRGSARQLRDFRQDVAEVRYRAAGVQDPDSLRTLVAADAGVRDAEGLVDIRAQQFEDWAALGLFFILISAADAFVSGHLQDFPAPLSLRAFPTSFGSVPGRIEAAVTLPWSGPRPRESRGR